MGVQVEVQLDVTFRPGLPQQVEYCTSAPGGICREQSEPESESLSEPLDCRVART